MSTAILALSENGDLQKIHDKWLTRGACSSTTDELDSNRLNLSSFWGLFLICGLACFIALLVYLVQMVRQFSRHSVGEEISSSSERGSTRSGRSLHRFLSFVDDKEEDVKNRSRTRQLQMSAGDGSELES